MCSFVPFYLTRYTHSFFYFFFLTCSGNPIYENVVIYFYLRFKFKCILQAIKIIKKNTNGYNLFYNYEIIYNFQFKFMNTCLPRLRSESFSVYNDLSSHIVTVSEQGWWQGGDLYPSIKCLRAYSRVMYIY